MKVLKIPDATVNRLSSYSRILEEMLTSNLQVISSEKLAMLCGVNSTQIRKDLAYFGEFGVRGVGYSVPSLLQEIKTILGMNRKWNLGLIGVGNLGSALAANENFRRQGYIFAAAFDIDPAKIGRKLPGGLIIEHLDDLPGISQTSKIDIGVIATPANAAQRVASRLIKAEIKAIINFAPVRILVPKGCHVKNMDFTIELNYLTFHLTRENDPPEPAA